MMKVPKSYDKTSIVRCTHDSDLVVDMIDHLKDIPCR